MVQLTPLSTQLFCGFAIPLNTFFVISNVSFVQKPFSIFKSAQVRDFWLLGFSWFLRICMRIRNWCVCSGCAIVPDPYAQRAHKDRSMRVRNSIFSTIFKVPKTAKILKNRYWHKHMVSKASQKKFFLVQTQQKSLLKIRLSIRVRKFAAQNEPLNIFFKAFYFNPKVALPWRLNGVKIMKIRAIENLTLGHL